MTNRDEPAAPAGMIRPTFRRTLAITALALPTFFLVWMATSHLKIFSKMELGILDTLFDLRQTLPELADRYASERVLLTGIDEDSIAQIGKWPWRRNVHATYLDNIQPFSPAGVLFDLLFIDRDTPPDYVLNQASLNPEFHTQLESIWNSMDGELARALGACHNVFIDVQLMDGIREGLPASYMTRIHDTENWLLARSLVTTRTPNDRRFFSLEPILNEYTSNAIPAVVNVARDSDATVRFWALYHTYMHENIPKNVPTIVLELLMRHYRVSRHNVAVTPSHVTLQNAKVPNLDLRTRRPIDTLTPLPDLQARLANPTPPPGYSYNTNFYRFLVAFGSLAADTQDRSPYFSLPILIQTNRQLEILDSWEIYHAALQLKSKSVRTVYHTLQNVDILTASDAQFMINFARRPVVTQRDDGTTAVHDPIPTLSYNAVHNMDKLPDLPPFDESGKPVTDSHTSLLIDQWFFNYCATRANEALDRARAELGENISDSTQLIEFMNRAPHNRKFFFYYDFLSKSGAEPGKLDTVLEEYPQYGREMGQKHADFLSKHQIILALVEEYRARFDQFHDKFVFVGGTALGIGDEHVTPSGTMPGIKVIMNAFGTIATNNQLRKSVDTPWLDQALLLGICIFFGFLYGLMGPRSALAAQLLSQAGILTVALILFIEQNIVLSTIPLITGNLTMFIVANIYKLRTEQRERRFLKATFGSYVSPDLINAMIASGTHPELGGETAQISQFFTDIAGFSSFSEILTAQQLVELLNEYLSSMTDTLLADRGTLDKYEGDAIIAFFGAPLPVPDHALRACRVALTMQNNLEKLTNNWRDQKQAPNEPDRNTKGLPPNLWTPGDKWPRLVHNMRMRVGINTGEAVVGNMGSATRMNYTMMGDSVNLAARLEAAAKQYGVHTLASHNTLNMLIPGEPGTAPHQVKDLIHARKIDRIAVVGRSEPVEVFELIALKDQASDRDLELIRLFEQALKAYFNTEWQQARKLFTQSAELEKNQGASITPSAIFIQRCDRFAQTPPVQPGQPWNGVHALSQK